MDISEVELVGKTVMSDEGIPIGIIKESFLDKKTGEIKTVLIEPSKEIDENNYKKNEQGKIILSFDNICSVQDILINERKLINSI